MVFKKKVVSLHHQTERPGVFPATLKLKDMTKKTTISDFRFEFAGYGHYKVTYTSSVTGKQWTVKTNDMPLIDATKNADEPKRRDLETLKRVCKNG